MIRSVRGSKCSVSCTTSPPPRRSSSCRAISAWMPRSMKRKEFMFFSSVFVPSTALPTGRSEMLASQRSEPSSMFTSLTPVWRSVVRSSSSQARASSAAWQVGLGDDLRERRAAAVEVDDARVRAVDAAARADVDELRRVLLEVHAVDAHVAEPPAPAQGLVVLADLVAPSASRDRSSSCGGRSTARRARTRARGRSSARCGSPARWPPAARRAAPRQTGQVRVFGGSPNDSSQPQNIFVRVASWTWISRPMTGS